MLNDYPTLTLILPSLSLLILPKTDGIRLIGGMAWVGGFFISIPIAPFYLIGTGIFVPLLVAIRVIVTRITAKKAIFNSVYVLEGITRILIIVSVIVGIVASLNITTVDGEKSFTLICVGIAIIPLTIFCLSYGTVRLTVVLYRWVRAGF